MAIRTVNIVDLTPVVRRKSAAQTADDKVVAAKVAAAEAAFRANLPACTDPSGHSEGFMGFCSHCDADVLFEDSDEYEAMFPLFD